jgi:hypothetical protein
MNILPSRENIDELIFAAFHGRPVYASASLSEVRTRANGNALITKIPH